MSFCAPIKRVLYRKVWSEQRELLVEEYITENHALMMYDPYIEQKEEKA